MVIFIKSAVAAYNFGTGICLEAKFSNPNANEFISGSSSGDILLWDIRSSHPLLKIESVFGKLEHFTIHDEAPLMATYYSLIRFNDRKILNVMNFRGKLLGNIHGTSGVLSRSALDCQYLSFHPKKLLLASLSGTAVHFFQSKH